MEYLSDLRVTLLPLALQIFFNGFLCGLVPTVLNIEVDLLYNH